MPTRQLFWNVEGSHQWLYVFLFIALSFFGYGVYRRVRLWRLGQYENRWKNIWREIIDPRVYYCGYKRMFDEFYPGLIHFSILCGFAFLAFATSMVALQADLGLPIFQGRLYLFVKLTANLFGLLAIIAVLLAMYRRYIQRPVGLDNKPDDAITLILFFLVLATGFAVQGLRMAAVPDPWAAWSFVGLWMSVPLRSLSVEQLVGLHKYIWWVHLGLAMGFIGYLPYSKLFHTIMAPLSIFFRKRGPVGVPRFIDLEDEKIESYGKSQLSELSWKELFDSDVCMRCGRCMTNCPANLTGKHLNPKQSIQDIRTLMLEVDSGSKGNFGGVNQVSGVDQVAATKERMAGESDGPTGQELIGDVISEEDIWSCTTCRACEQLCPVFVEHVDKTIEMRRNLVLMESRFPAEIKLVFRNIENNSNPWNICWGSRADFFTGLGIKTLAEDPDAEYLYFPGCSGSLDARNQKVSAALVKLLQASGVHFAILGNEERCCGDFVRKLGNEYLYQFLATKNINVLKKHGVKKIITQCPHCFNVLKNEYPQLGGDFEVIHHSVFLMDLVKAGKLKLNSSGGKTVTYHDSCVLGRYNQIYEQPRELLKAAGLTIKEMERTGKNSFCCGAGGGRAWLEENEGSRINNMRTSEAIAVNPDYVGTACPFCLTMFADGIAHFEADDKLQALDIAEIIVKGL